MRPALRALLPVIALSAVLFGGTAIAADATSALWSIQFHGSATSDGEVHLRVTPQTGEPIVVNIKIHAGRGEMFMAKDVLAALKSQLPKGQYKSEIVHGQEVLLKAGHGQPAFGVELVDSNVAGTKLQIAPG